MMNPIQASVLYVSRQRYKPSHKRLPNFPRMQKENGPRPCLASGTILVQGTQSQSAVMTCDTPSITIADTVHIQCKPCLSVYSNSNPI
jgi:hypothetical protein